MYCVCPYKEGVVDHTALFFLPSAPSVAMERYFFAPIGGEINTIFNWPGGLPPVWERV